MELPHRLPPVKNLRKDVELALLRARSGRPEEVEKLGCRSWDGAVGAVGRCFSYCESTDSDENFPRYVHYTCWN